MSEQTVIRITTIESVQPLQMRPSIAKLADSTVAKTVDVAVDLLTRRLSAEVEKLHRVFSELPAVHSHSSLTSATLTLGIDAAGEVSLCSVATGSITGQAAITLTFTLDGKGNVTKP